MKELGFEPDPKFAIAVKIWAQYYVATETYDRTLPGNWLHGEWMPRFDARPSSLRFAKQQMEAAKIALNGAGIDRKTSQQAKEHCAKHGHETLKWMLEDEK